MKTLTFRPNNEHQNVYQCLYQASLHTERPFVGGETRVIAKVQTKLEAVGKYDPDTKLYGLVDPVQVSVELEDSEFNLLRESFNLVKWRGSGAKAAAQTYDYLESVANGASA